jgi:inosine-uridine nucleoside N-ribohydrolase
MILYLDCDTGVDDALALAVLLADPDVRIAGIGTVSGNTSAQQAAANTLNLLALAGRRGVPVAVGARHPLAGAYTAGAEEVHGDNGIGGVTLPPSPERPIDAAAADLLVELARAYGRDLHVLATGPLTNLAQALAREPRLPRLVASVTAMGGAVRVPGNVTGHAEANIASDPEAAEAVFAAPWPVTLVPLDVTMEHRFSVTEQAELAAGTPFQQALAAMLTTYLDYYEPVLGERRTPLHDPLAAVVALGAVPLGDAPALGIRVDTTDGPERGRLVEDPAAPAIRVVLSLAAPAAPVIRTAVLAA